MYTAIVLAAGMGSRMGLGYNKMLYTLAEEPVFVHTLRKFQQDPHCGQLILVINPQDRESIGDWLPEGALVVEGGAQRQDSVYAGLLAATEDIVLVHDGARPFLSQSMIDGCVEWARQGGAAVVAVPVKDTIKRVGADGIIEETLVRDELVSVQTPQAASYRTLKRAHLAAQAAGFLGTDEASLIEKFTDVQVKVIEGSYTNIKLTTAEDLILAKRLLKEGF